MTNLLFDFGFSYSALLSTVLSIDLRTTDHQIHIFFHLCIEVGAVIPPLCMNSLDTMKSK